MVKAHPVAIPVKLTGRLSEFREALQDEIKKVEENGQNSTLLVGGHKIDAKGSGFWYRFFVEYMPVLPADTPCKLTIGTDQYDVTVISTTENEIIISSMNKLPANIGKAKLENGSTVLMERLIKRIEENADKANPAGERMFCDSDGNVYPVKRLFSYDVIHYGDHSNEGQKNAVQSAIENDITYIWGPPGTGKTTVIGKIIDELYGHERSVLIVSHTNTAVDGAIIKAVDSYKKSHGNSVEDYPILRLGITPDDFPHEAELEAHVERLGEELIEREETLEKRRQGILFEIEKINIILAKDNWLKNSHLSALKGISETIDQQQKRKSKEEDQLAKLQAEYNQVFKTNPNGKVLLQLEGNLQEKRVSLKQTQEERSLQKERIKKAEHQYICADDQIKIHAVYDGLTQKIQQLMSEQFYKEKIFETESAIKPLESSLKVLKEKQNTLQESIVKYESKGSVAKFFAGKVAYEQDQRSLSETKRNLEIKAESLQQKERLLEEYKKQLSELRYLLDKRKAVMPSKSIKYWTEEKQRLQDKLSVMKDRLSELTEYRDNLSSEIASLELKKKDNQRFLETVESIQAKINLCQQTIDEAKKQIEQNRKTFIQLLEDERVLCELFQEFHGLTANETIERLSITNSKVREELYSVDIEEEKKQKELYEEETNKILAELSEIQKKMAELEKQAIMNARIIGTTLAKSYLSDILRERQFDTVILDEASMASIPALWCAAYLAEKNIVIVGDFLQLPPIVMANTPMAQKWLGRDIFDHSGMQEMAKKKNKSIRPMNFAMLNEQYRMESDIAEIANLYYGEYTKLKSYDMNPKREEDRDTFYSWYSGNKTTDHIHLIDTESLHAWVTGIPQAKSHSRLNSFSAAVDIALAFKCIDKYMEDKLYEKAEYQGTKVLIVAPYKPHVNLLNKLIDDEYRKRGIRSDCGLVKAGTIHSFQGSEADIVIFDLVIDEPHYKAGIFMPTSEGKSDFRKMFNVAVTRAKFKLYVVGDFKYCQSKAAKESALFELLKYLTDRYKKVDAKKQLLPKMITPPQYTVTLAETPNAASVFLTESQFHEYFVEDIQSFKQNMIIYSPFMTLNRLSILLPAFYAATSQGKRIVVITKPLEEKPKSELAQYKKCEEGLRNIGVSILHKKGMHEKIILIDEEIIWTGSLNALSYTGNTGEVMERRIDNSSEKSIINSYIKVLDIKYLVDAIKKEYETKCPLCGGEMLIKESPKGGIYWECVEKDYLREKDQQYPLDGVLRCAKCDSPLKFSMIKKPRWVCTSDSKHYQYLRKNDLKLPHMAALLSQAEKKQVQEFFQELAKK